MAQSRTQSPTVHLLPEVHRTLKLLAVEQGRTLQQVVDEALEQYLGRPRSCDAMAGECPPVKLSEFYAEVKAEKERMA